MTQKTQESTQTDTHTHTLVAAKQHPNITGPISPAACQNGTEKGKLIKFLLNFASFDRAWKTIRAHAVAPG